MAEKTLEEKQAELIEAGWNEDVAEALAERGYTRNTARHLSVREAFEVFLEWNGIIGWTGRIINALDNCRNMEAL